MHIKFITLKFSRVYLNVDPIDATKCTVETGYSLFFSYKLN